MAGKNFPQKPFTSSGFSRQSIKPVEQVLPTEEPKPDDIVDDADDSVVAETQPVIEVAQETAQESTQPEVVETVVEVKPVVEERKQAVTEVKQDPPVNRSKAVKSVRTQLVTYHEVMNPTKPISEQAGGKAQFTLYKLIRSILSEDDQAAFKEKWTEVLSYFLEFEKELFNENYIYRFPNTFPGSDLDISIWRRLMWILIATANPATRRKNMNKIILEKALEGLSVKERENLIGYYA